MAERERRRAKRRKRDLGLYVIEEGRWKLLYAELDWEAYLAPERAKRPEAELFDAVLDYLWDRMGEDEEYWGRYDRERARGFRRLRSLVAAARRISPAGKAALLKDRGVWQTATLVPSMGGEIEQVRSETRQVLEFYVRKYGAGRRRA